MPTPLPLLLAPRDSLPVLLHLAENPVESPWRACNAMGLSSHTFYEAAGHLENLGLITPSKGPAGRKVQRYLVTPEGERVVAQLKAISAEIAGSRAGLEWKLASDPPLKGSPESGAVLCGLIELAQRRGDFKELLRLSRSAEKMSRPGEASLALAILAFLQARPAEAVHRAETAVKVLKKEGNTRSLRKVMSIEAGAVEYTGRPEKAIGIEIEVRKLAKKAGDADLEAESWMGIAIMHARLEHTADALREFEKALKIATDAKLEAKRAKILGNYAFAQGLEDPHKGLALADEALAEARKGGATIVVARTQLTRALLLGALKRPKEARAAMAEAQRIFKAGGEEKGAQVVKDWAGLVKRISRRRRGPYPIDWKSEALALARTRPK